MTRIVFSSLVLVVLVARSAHAVVTGTIVGPGSESFPIAVVPPKNLGGDPGGALGARFAKALTRDLDFSGYFKLLDPKTFVENPETSGITAGEIDFVGWAAIGAQALVKGGISAAGNGISLEVRLFDVPEVLRGCEPTTARFQFGVQEAGILELPDLVVQEPGT